MIEGYIPEVPENPYKDQPCGACKSKEWASAKISPRTMCPIECDRCPPKPKDTQTPRGSQEVQ